MSGLYVLHIAIGGAEEISCEIGALGTRHFAPGRYAYVGSAHGPGGFSRVDRHVSTAAGERDTRHWHIDYLLSHNRVRIEDTTRLPDLVDECRLAKTIPGHPVPKVGSSDCECTGHLLTIAASPSAVKRSITQFVGNDPRC